MNTVWPFNYRLAETHQEPTAVLLGYAALYISVIVVLSYLEFRAKSSLKAIEAIEVIEAILN